MNRINFDTPKHISEVKEQFDVKKVSLLTRPNLYPLISGVEFSGSASFILEKKKTFPIKRKMDAHIEAYETAMLKEWEKAKKKLLALKNKVKEFKKMDYNNAQTIDRIGKIPFKYKKQFVEVTDKYDLNLAMLDKIVLNPSLLVNARYDNRKNLMELNPDYLEQHGMIRIGDSGEVISETSKTFIHEFGHCLWYNSLSEEDRRYWQGLTRFLRRNELTGDMTQYVVGEKKRFDGSTMYSPFYTLRDDPFVSVYARFNQREDFAECFLYYKVAPKTLERIDKRKYTFMEDKVGNRIEKEIKKVFAPSITDRNKLRDQIISALYNMKDGLSYKAKEHITNAYNLGRQKGAYFSNNAYDPKLTQEDKDKIQEILERNDEYLDDFTDELSDDYDKALFVLTPTGFVESEKVYDSVDEFDQSFDDVLSTKEHRLSVYAINGLSLGLIAGMVQESQEDFGGGYWHTQPDDRVCDGCQRLDGQWMSYDEFLTIYGGNDCDGNCRCGELFEPTPAPEGAAMTLMVKGGEGSGRYPKGSGQDRPVYQTKWNPTFKDFYHNTLTENLKSIAENGLLPGGGGKGIPHPGQEWSPTHKAIYLHPSEEPAKRDSVEGITYLRIDIPIEHRDSVREGEEGEPMFIKPIPPEWIYVKSGTQWARIDKKFGKAGAGENAYMDSGVLGTTVRETHPELDEDAHSNAKSKIVAVDYHGTIMINNNPNQEVVNKLKEFKDAGYHIIVYTSGITRNPSILNGINTWLKENQIPYDEVWQRQGKPDADLYIEDKAVRPSEMKDKTLEQIEDIPNIEDKTIGG